MSVFTRLTNSGGGTTATTTPTVAPSSVYNRLATPVSTSTPASSSVFDRLMSKPAPVSTTTPTVSPEVKTPFDATTFGIGVNTILGIPKAAEDLNKSALNFLSDKIKSIPENLSKEFNPSGILYTGPSGKINLNPEVSMNLMQPALGAINEEGTLAKSAFKKIASLRESGAISKILEDLGIKGETAIKYGEKLVNVSDEKIVAKTVKAAQKEAKELQQASKSVLETSVPSTPITALQKRLLGEGAVSSEKGVGQNTVSSVKPTIETPKVSSEGGFVKVPKLVDEAKPSYSPEVDSYLKEQIASQEAARNKGVVSGIKNTTSNIYKEVKKKLVDFAAPIEDTLRIGTKNAKMSMLPSADITNQIDRVLKTPTIAGQFVKDHGLDTVIKNTPDIEALDQYLIAKQAIAVDTRGINTGRNLTKDTQLVKELAPIYDEAAQKVTKYSQDLLDYATESGLIDPKIAEILKKRYPDYVPLNRIFSEMEQNGGVFGGKSIANLSKQTIVQPIKGSDRVIESPIRSILEKTGDAFKQGERNKAARILASYEKIPGNPFGLRELKGSETAPHTISFLDNGVKRTFATTKDVAEAAKALNVQQLNVLGKIFATPVRLAKLGITGINLPFVASNIVKDQISGAINSSNALKTSIANPVVFFKSLLEAVGHGKVYDEMIRNGAMGTSFDIARNSAPLTIERIRAGRSVGSKIAYTIKHPSELLRAVEDIVGRSEELSRIQQYSGTKVAESKIWDPASTEILASRAGRENTVNFARRGEWGQVLNSAFLYLNAGIQGSRTFVRTFKTRPVETATKLALVVFTPVAATTAWNLSDPTRKAAYDDIADFEKQNNIIIVPPNPTKNADGTWNVIKIPLSQEINNLASMARRPIEAAYGLDPVTVGDISKALIGSVSPVTPDANSVLSTVVPQAVKPSIEAAVNRNLFTGIPTVPASMEKLSPENQYKSYSSGTVRAFGKATGLSPLKIEAFLKGTFGGIAPQAINIVDNAAAGMGFIPKDQIGGQNVIKAIVGRFADARGGKNDQLDETLSKMITAQVDDAFLIKTEAEGVYQAMLKIPKDQASIKFNEMVKNNPKLAQAVSSVAEDTKMGLNYADRMLKTLQVNNGNRAKYIAEELKQFKTVEEKKAKWNEYVQKKIITAAVAAQLTSLLKQNK